MRPKFTRLKQFSEDWKDRNLVYKSKMGKSVVGKGGEEEGTPAEYKLLI